MRSGKGEFFGFPVVEHGRSPKNFVGVRFELLGKAIRSHVHCKLGNDVRLAGFDEKEVMGREVGVLEGHVNLLPGFYREGLYVVDQLFLYAGDRDVDRIAFRCDVRVLES